MVRSGLRTNLVRNMILILYVFWKYFGEPEEIVSVTATHTGYAVFIIFAHLYAVVCLFGFLFGVFFFLRQSGTSRQVIFTVYLIQQSTDATKSRKRW